MNKKTKIFIVGRTGSGKSTVEKYLKDKYDYKILKSYTTRKPYGEDDDSHIFVDEEFMKSNNNDIIAFANINNTKYFSTYKQFEENDVYVINPDGLKKLIQSIKIRPEIYHFVILHIQAKEKIRKDRTSNRGNYDFYSRNKNEDIDFKEFELRDLSYFGPPVNEIEISLFNLYSDDKIFGKIDKIIHFIKNN